MPRTSDVYIESHFKDGASAAASRSFARMTEEVTKTEKATAGSGKAASKSAEQFGVLGKVIGGLVTVEMAKKLAVFTVEITKMSSEGARAVNNLNTSWVGLQKTLGTVLQMPLSGGFEHLGRVVDGVSVQVEAFSVLYHKIFGGIADTPTINRLLGTEKKPIIDLKGELAKEIRQAQVDERIAAIGADVDKMLAEQREKRAREEKEAEEKRIREFEERAKREGAGNIGRIMHRNLRKQMRGEVQQPSLLTLLMDPSTTQARKVAEFSNASALLVGSKFATGLGRGFKSGLEESKDDFNLPALTLADEVAIDFRERFTGVLAGSYEDLLRGDFEKAIKGLGSGTTDLLVEGFSEKLADATINSRFGQKISDFVGKGTEMAVEGIGDIVSKGLDKGLDMEKLRSLGARAGGDLKRGVDAGFDWLFPDVSASWGPQGETFKAIKGGMENALKGGVMGAGIGTLISESLGSSEMTRRYTQIGASIGGAITGAIGAPGGGLIGSLIGSLAGQLWQTAASKQAEGEFKELLVDVGAFGGFKGFVARTGGLSGFRGTRRHALAGDFGRQFATILRQTEGLTKDQADALVQVLREGGVMGASLIDLPEAMETQVLNVMRNLGFSQADIDRAAGLIQPRVITPPPDLRRDPEQEEFDRLTAAVPEAGVQPQLSPVDQATQALTRMLQDNTISRKTLRDLGINVFSEAANRMGGGFPAYIPALRGVLAGSPHDEAWLRRRGVDVVAAHGFMGTVNRPTRFLAGEAGPEDVMVVPHTMRRHITSGGLGRGGAVLNVQMQINTPNVESTREWARREFYPMIRSFLMEDSNAGQPIIRSRGVVQG